MPPMPSARSSAIDPVGIESICMCELASPIFMIAPLPNCRSIWEIASSMARSRSVIGYPLWVPLEQVFWKIVVHQGPDYKVVSRSSLVVGGFSVFRFPTRPRLSRKHIRHCARERVPGVSTGYHPEIRDERLTSLTPRSVNPPTPPTGYPTPARYRR